MNCCVTGHSAINVECLNLTEPIQIGWMADAIFFSVIEPSNVKRTGSIQFTKSFFSGKMKASIIPPALGPVVEPLLGSEVC